MPARHASKKAVYRIRNWTQDNEALVRRGSLTLGVEQATLKEGRSQEPTQRGAPFQYRDLAIACLRTLRAVDHLPRRATEGVARSLCEVMGSDLSVPDSSTLSRRAATVRVTLPKRAEGPLPLVLDSTGLKVYGQGEWKVRQHGYSQRRTWLKLPLAVDPGTPEIQAAMVSVPGVTDAEATPRLREQVENPVEIMRGDGMYDRRAVYAELERRGARAVIPPRRDAKIGRQGHSAGPRLARDENLRRIRRIGREAWKRESGYPKRLLGETAMFRMKTIFGDGGSSRRPAQQATEAGIRCRALNIMTHQGMPQSVLVA
jgi:Transposase DDE domain